MDARIARTFSRLLAAFAGLTCAAALAATPMLKPHEGPMAKSARPRDVATAGFAVAFNLEALKKLKPGEEAELSLPNGTLHAIVFDRLIDHGDGNTSWIGHYKGATQKLRTIVTNGPGGSFGRIATPAGDVRLMPGEGHDWLVDMAAEEQYLPPIDLSFDAVTPPPLPATNEPLHPPQYADMPAASTTVPFAKVAPTPTVIVDIMFVYTNGLQASLGSAANVLTRINNLIAASNQAYIDSEVAIQLRLVNTTMVTYSDATDAFQALTDITPNPTAPHAAFSTIESIRASSGADMVALLRNGPSFGGNGIGWIADAPMAAVFKPYMYSVTTGCTAGCEFVFIHELGHNMGNAHDRATAAWDGSSGGSYPYSYGHYSCAGGRFALTCAAFSGACGVQPECTTAAGSTNNFADIMAYFHASASRNLKFSNPQVNCQGALGTPTPCGIADPAVDSADTARSMNQNRVALSGLLPTMTGSTATTTVVASSLNPSMAGQAVTFTATVSAATGTPAGTMDFRSGGVSISGCAAVALSSASAMCTTSALAAGSRSITAVYSGSGTHSTSTSAALTQVVSSPLPVPSVSLTSSSNPSVMGESVTFTASLAGSAGSVTGTVNFRDGATSLTGCAAVGIVTGVATCTLTTFTTGTHAISAVYSGSVAYGPATSGTVTQDVQPGGIPGSTNVALAAAGSVATASSQWNANFAPSALINGDRSGAGYAAGGTWQDSTGGVFPDWVQIDFGGSRTIDRVVVFSVQDNYSAPSMPTDPMTFATMGVSAFNVQGWSGSAWVTLASVSGNDKVKSQVIFAMYTTTRIRVNVTASRNPYSRLAEIEAWGVAASAAPPVAPTVTLASSLNPSTTGQSITLTANASGSAGLAIGTVDFRDGATSISGCASVTLIGSGIATCTTAGLTAGAHSLTAVYGGSTAYTAGTSNVVTQTVNAPPAAVTPTVGLASSLNPSNSGQSVTFTAAVTGSAGTATGTVNFLDGASAISGCSGLALSGGSVGCTTLALTVGTHSVTAQYSGSVAYNPATSGAVSQVVNAVAPPPPGSSINVALAANGGVATVSSQFNANYPAGAAINGDRRGLGYGAGGTWQDATGGVYPDWLQVVFNGSKTIDSAIVYSVQDAYTSPVEPTALQTFSSMGIVAFTVQGWSGSAWVTLATVTGNNLVKKTVTFAPYTTTQVRINVTGTKGPYTKMAEVEVFGVAAGGPPPPPALVTPTVVVASSLNPSVSGGSVTFTATITGSAGTPTGTVNFRDGAVSLPGCSAVATAGTTAACTLSGLTIGTHSITAAYSGNASYNPATSAAVSQVVNSAALATPTVGIASSPSPSTSGQSVTFVATVSGGVGTPTGTVNFRDGASSIPGCSAVAISSGSASCTTATLTVGSHSVTALYSGNGSYNPGTSIPLTQTVNAASGVSANVALSSVGGMASASSTWNANFPPSALINNERAGRIFGSGGTWGDATGGVFPDWVQIDFAGAKTIDRVVVYTLQDNYTNPSEPTDSMMFSTLGVTAFNVQGWNGSAWVTLATVTGSTNVKRTVTFAAFTTPRIRVNITASRGPYSRLAEIEAWGF